MARRHYSNNVHILALYGDEIHLDDSKHPSFSFQTHNEGLPECCRNVIELINVTWQRIESAKIYRIPVLHLSTSIHATCILLYYTAWANHGYRIHASVYWCTLWPALYTGKQCIWIKVFSAVWHLMHGVSSIVMYTNQHTGDGTINCLYISMKAEMSMHINWCREKKNNKKKTGHHSSFTWAIMQEIMQSVLINQQQVYELPNMRANVFPTAICWYECIFIGYPS